MKIIFTNNISIYSADYNNFWLINHMEKTMKYKFLILTMFLFSLPNLGHTTPISPAGVSGTGSYNNNPSLIIDGTFPAEGSGWTNPTNVWWNGTAPIFTIDLGLTYNVDDILVSVDNNDSYSIQWSMDSSSWNSLFSINIGDGDIGWGMDTFSTDSTNGEYVSGLDFSSVQAQYIRIFATGGDNSYSIGELQVFGSSAAVPEPAPLALLGFGLLGFGLMRKRKS